MVKHIQTIRRQKPTNGLSVLENFVGLVLKELSFVLQMFTQNFLLLKPLTIFVKNVPLLDVWRGSKYDPTFGLWLY